LGQGRPATGKELIMKSYSALRSTTANVVIGLGPALVGPIAVAEGLADAPPKPMVVEIDEAALKIDIVAHLRAVRASLKQAHVIEVDPSKAEREAKVAANERRERG
jgi:hypothetical protein